ncbi:MAG TPA: CHAD domain-containing protein [Propionibacteriaceae bacterium]|nr:CHAD domain-containing protein [Propionibacteriaceae bacterium]
MAVSESTRPILLTASIESSDDALGGSHGRLDVVAGALAEAFTVRQTGRSVEVMTHLDSADWRLLRHGVDVVSMSGSGELLAFGRDGLPVVQSAGSPAWPALVTKIADGPVRDIIAGSVGVRALIPFATSRADVVSFAVLNEDAKTVARVHWRDVRIDSPVERRLPASVAVDGLRGYAAEAREVERLLVEGASMSTSTRTWLDVFRDVPGIGPEGHGSGIHRHQAAHLAVADALLGYVSVMESTVEGIVADVDTEFLHDFRVAVRRTRSVLKLLGGVLPEGVAERVGAEFRWLGRVTTPTRDLDVYLLGIDDMASSLTRRDDLDAFGRHLVMRRTAEHKLLARALRSPRFIDLLSSWRSELGELISAPSHQNRTAAQLADEQLHKTYRKVTKRAKAISVDSPSEQIHALRRTCKEMRYVLEVFQPLCDPKAYKQVASDFKGLQDVLGEFQDGEVQANALHVFAQEMLDAGEVDVNALLAMGELSARFETKQRAARETLVTHHDGYLGARSSAHVDRLVRV